MIENENFDVVEAFIKKRVLVLEEQGMSAEAAKVQAKDELFRELGIDSLIAENSKFHTSSLERTLFYLYKDEEDESSLRQTLIDGFADGTLDSANYCISDQDYENF